MKIETGNIPAVNFHLWEPCNMNCKFCFATFQDVKSTVLPKGHLSKEDCLKVVDAMNRNYFSKITFAGGEPLLCPWLGDVLKLAKKNDLTTMIVTNGAQLKESFLNEHHDSIDWITFSIDSLDPKVLKATGRMERSKPMSEYDYLDKIEMARKYDIKIKINTVVTSQNADENLSNFILKANPVRWKIFQVLPIKGQNDQRINDFLIDGQTFGKYVSRHEFIEQSGIKIVPENNNAMKGTYMMIDPAGRFFDNNDDSYRYSEPILNIGLLKALRQVNTNYDKFQERGGHYDWD